jgi:hypothetical protein
MRPLPDETVRGPDPPSRGRRDWLRYGSGNPACYFCLFIFNPVRTEDGELVRDWEVFACDHPERAGTGLMDRREALDRRCGFFREDDRDSGCSD